jgi:uncharacterized protein involved in exopolysaccharide biosynthesis
MSDEISVRRIVSAAMEHWKLMLLLPLLGAVLAVGSSLLMTRIYRAQSVVTVAQAESINGGSLARLAGQLGAIGGLVSGLGFGGNTDQSELWIATLRSRAALEAFVRKYDLLPTLFHQRWDPVKKSWKPRDGKELPPSMDDAVLKLKGVIGVNEDKRTGLITVSVKWKDREVAARWANDFVALVNEIARTRTVEESRRSIGFLEAELEKTNVVERRQIIYRLIESRVNDIMLAQGRLDYAFAVVDPATVPDKDKYASPRRFVLLVLGLFGGFLVASLVTFQRVVLKRR